MNRRFMGATYTAKPPRDFPPYCVFCGKKLWRHFGKRRAGWLCARCP